MVERRPLNKRSGIRAQLSVLPREIGDLQVAVAGANPRRSKAKELDLNYGNESLVRRWLDIIMKTPTFLSLSLQNYGLMKNRIVSYLLLSSLYSKRRVQNINFNISLIIVFLQLHHFLLPVANVQDYDCKMTRQHHPSAFEQSAALFLCILGIWIKQVQNWSNPVYLLVFCNVALRI